MKKAFLVLGIVLIFISTLVGINNDIKEKRKKEIEKQEQIKLKI